MANYYFTIPDSVTLPTDGNKVSLTTDCELHRDDSALPNALTVAADSYNVFLADTPGTGTATAPDVTAPTLSSPTGAKSGETGATSLGVSTNEGNGTLYWGIYPTASTPSAADVVAGTGATVNGSQAVSGTGVQSVSDQTGLTAATAYKAHYVQDDAASNRSSVATSSEFTTDAASSSIDPAVSSLLGAKSKIRHDPTDWSTLWQDTSGTVAVTAAGQAVRRIDDTSGSGRHLTALSGNAIAQVGYLDWNDATFQYAPVPNLTSTSEFYALIDPDGDSVWIFMGVQGNSGMYEGTVQDGGSGNVGNGFGSGVNVIDNTPVSPVTRQQMYDTMIAGGGYKVQGIRGINMSNAAQVFLPLGYDTASPVEFSGRVKYLSISDALTTGERSSLQTIFDGEK